MVDANRVGICVGLLNHMTKSRVYSYSVVSHRLIHADCLVHMSDKTGSNLVIIDTMFNQPHMQSWTQFTNTFMA